VASNTHNISAQKFQDNRNTTRLPHEKTQSYYQLNSLCNLRPK